MTHPESPDPLPAPTTDAADPPERYERMTLLAGLIDETAELLRDHAERGTTIIHDPAFHESADLSAATAARVEEDIRSASTGKRGLVHSAVELDTDAVVLRATVQTYRWIDDLQLAAFATLGTIAGRAIGYFAPRSSWVEPWSPPG